MTAESNTKFLVAVTGGIAAYKTAELVRLLMKTGADVQVLMTESAKAFVAPLTFQALTGKAVRSSLLDPSAELGMGHIELARWADHIVIAPATADSIARIAHGFANDLLTTVLLAYQGPVSIAPAMNQAMWSNPITQANVARLRSAFPTWTWIGPDSGEQACGDVGPGRMAAPETIAERLIQQPVVAPFLAGKRVVITAGPTRERLDPVRYLSNFSSGKMGYALAEAAVTAGADVILVTGPVELCPPVGVQCIQVESGVEMYDAVMASVIGSDVFIATAAVADYRPDHVAVQKIKKVGAQEPKILNLIENPDIVASVAAMTKHRPWVVGFAAETQDALKYGQAKMQKKHLDMVVINDVSLPGLGFGSDNNQVTLLVQDSHADFGPASKKTVALWLMQQVASQLKKDL